RWRLFRVRHRQRHNVHRTASGGSMRTTFFLAVALAVATAALQAHTGNGAPSGSHYNLNIIGVSHDKNANMDQGSGSVIFVDRGCRPHRDQPVRPLPSGVLLASRQQWAEAVAGALLSEPCRDAETASRRVAVRSE